MGRTCGRVIGKVKLFLISQVNKYISRQKLASQARRTRVHSSRACDVLELPPDMLTSKSQLPSVSPYDWEADCRSQECTRVSSQVW